MTDPLSTDRLREIAEGTATWKSETGPAGVLWYLRLDTTAKPPYRNQRRVEAILDIAADGTLAGIELIDNMPPAPLALRASKPEVEKLIEAHKLDTDKQVFFYEQDFYVLSNFSAFSLDWRGVSFPTSEHAYHWEKFDGVSLSYQIRVAPSAHEAFKLAEAYKDQRIPNWDQVKVGIMREILRAKADQHEYVRRKLLATGDRELIEDSWRDDFWGWGPNRDGQNMLGNLWMEIRSELRASLEGNRDER